MKDFTSMGLKLTRGELLVLDQTKLPHEEMWLKAETPADMIQYIKALKIRGAPLIGVAAAVSLARAVERGAQGREFFIAAKAMRAARPTAVNLMAAVDRLTNNQNEQDFDPWRVIKTAEEIFNEDVALCRSIGESGAALLKDGDNVLTHCNTGGLATAGIGTALGVIQTAFEQGKKLHVYVDETRPLLQGARLTSWELRKLGIPHTLICDGTAAHLMGEGKVQAVIVGADRIAANGDFANKIGTYGLAIAAAFHKIPFYAAAPRTTIDMSCPDGKHIPIEERDGMEVVSVHAPRDTRAYNPAFDVTPAQLVTGYILESGLFRDLVSHRSRAGKS